MKKFRFGLGLGLAGGIAMIISLFLSFAEAGDESESLIGIAKIYTSSDSVAWGDKTYESFYKVFVPLMLGLIALFTVIYLIKCLKKRPVGMIIATIFTIIACEILKWDFADRGVVPGNCDKGIAFAVIYIAYVLMIAGGVMTIVDKKKDSVG